MIDVEEEYRDQVRLQAVYERGTVGSLVKAAGVERWSAGGVSVKAWVAERGREVKKQPQQARADDSHP
jgi:hypothetical protein